MQNGQWEALTWAAVSCLPCHTVLQACLDGGDPRTRAFFNNDRRWLAAAQTCLPVVQGGLGLGCARMTGDAAYVAGWADYLRFLNTYPDLFPAANAALDPASLSCS